MRPRLGEVEGVDAMLVGFGLCHDLNVHRPAREFLSFDAFEEVAVVTFPIASDKYLCLRIRQVSDAPDASSS